MTEADSFYSDSLPECETDMVPKDQYFYYIQHYVMLRNHIRLGTARPVYVSVYYW